MESQGFADKIAVGLLQAKGNKRVPWKPQYADGKTHTDASLTTHQADRVNDH